VAVTLHEQVDQTDHDEAGAQEDRVTPDEHRLPSLAQCRK
jgi:hypothetical protein